MIERVPLIEELAQVAASPDLTVQRPRRARPR
jgi:hypothetical protein